MGFSLNLFEAACYRRDKEAGMRLLVDLIQELDAKYGLVGDGFQAKALSALPEAESEQHVWTRIAAAASCLLSDPELQIAPEWQLRVLSLHRWMAALFGATPFRNADHVMRALNLNEDQGDLSQLRLKDEDLLKFALLYTPESEVPLDLDAMWASNPTLTAGLCLVLLSPRFLGSPVAHAKREVILPWLATRLDQVADIEHLPLGVLHDLYMHCSYADRADKHDIKKPINTLIRRKLADNGVVGLRPGQRHDAAPRPEDDKPVLLVVLEWFTKGHSIYRTHSRTMDSARELFRVVAIGYEDCADETTCEVFDEFINLDRALSLVDQLKFIQAQSRQLQAEVCYMPSVGMFPLTMWLANLRVAPLQMMALGHPATTHSDAIDYVVVEEDYVGDAACFSEKLLVLPPDGMPYRPSASAHGIEVLPKADMDPAVVYIAVCATTMKLNPGFLTACARIAQESRVKVHFQFLIGQNQGLVKPLLTSVVKQYLGDQVTVFPHQGYVPYMDVIAGCDMFINPFPFGNTNGIIDTVSAGLVGVCKTGPEVHEHIDEGLFGRLGLPDWLVTDSVNDYVAAAVRLAENHAERRALSKGHAGADKVTSLFEGRPDIMGQEMWALAGLEERVAEMVEA